MRLPKKFLYTLVGGGNQTILWEDLAFLMWGAYMYFGFNDEEAGIKNFDTFTALLRYLSLDQSDNPRVLLLWNAHPRFRADVDIIMIHWGNPFGPLLRATALGDATTPQPTISTLGQYHCHEETGSFLDSEFLGYVRRLHHELETLAAQVLLSKHFNSGAYRRWQTTLQSLLSITRASGVNLQVDVQFDD